METPEGMVKTAGEEDAAAHRALLDAAKRARGRVCLACVAKKTGASVERLRMAARALGLKAW